MPQADILSEAGSAHILSEAGSVPQAHILSEAGSVPQAHVHVLSEEPPEATPETPIEAQLVSEQPIVSDTSLPP